MEKPIKDVSNEPITSDVIIFSPQEVADLGILQGVQNPDSSSDQSKKLIIDAIQKSINASKAETNVTALPVSINSLQLQKNLTEKLKKPPPKILNSELTISKMSLSGKRMKKNDHVPWTPSRKRYRESLVRSSTSGKCILNKDERLKKMILSAIRSKMKPHSSSESSPTTTIEEGESNPTKKKLINVVSDKNVSLTKEQLKLLMKSVKGDCEEEPLEAALRSICGDENEVLTEIISEKDCSIVTEEITTSVDIKEQGYNSAQTSSSHTGDNTSAKTNNSQSIESRNKQTTMVIEEHNMEDVENESSLKKSPAQTIEDDSLGALTEEIIIEVDRETPVLESAQNIQSVEVNDDVIIIKASNVVNKEHFELIVDDNYLTKIRKTKESGGKDLHEKQNDLEGDNIPEKENRTDIHSDQTDVVVSVSKEDKPLSVKGKRGRPPKKVRALTNNDPGSSKTIFVDPPEKDVSQENEERLNRESEKRSSQETEERSGVLPESKETPENPPEVLKRKRGRPRKNPLDPPKPRKPKPDTSSERFSKSISDENFSDNLEMETSISGRKRRKINYFHMENSLMEDFKDSRKSFSSDTDDEKRSSVKIKRRNTSVNENEERREESFPKTDNFSNNDESVEVKKELENVFEFKTEEFKTAEPISEEVNEEIPQAKTKMKRYNWTGETRKMMDSIFSAARKANSSQKATNENEQDQNNEEK